MVAKFALKDLKTTICNYETQFHILRHFNVINLLYKNELKENLSCSNEKIEEQLKLTGSKFNYEFAINPKELINRIIEKDKSLKPEIIEKQDKIIIQIQYSKNKHINGIGTDSIININELSAVEKKSIQTEKRNENIVKTIKRKFEKTWQLNLIIGITDKNKYYIRTIFAGKFAPAFPNKENQSHEEYSTSKVFWKKHLFIIN